MDNDHHPDKKHATKPSRETFDNVHIFSGRAFEIWVNENLLIFFKDWCCKHPIICSLTSKKPATCVYKLTSCRNEATLDKTKITPGTERRVIEGQIYPRWDKVFNFNFKHPKTPSQKRILPKWTLTNTSTARHKYHILPCIWFQPTEKAGGSPDTLILITWYTFAFGGQLFLQV